MPYEQRRPGGGPRRGNDRQEGGRGRRDDGPRGPSLDTSGIELRPGANGALGADLFDAVAKRTAEVIALDKYRNKPSQIRQFYDEIVMWEEKVRQSRERFGEYLPFIRMLNAKAAYAEGRKHVDQNFVELIAHCMKQVDGPDTLRNFKLFFEAFLGFYKLERPSG
jgi:CRISPR-associated protein Csm2